VESGVSKIQNQADLAQSATAACFVKNPLTLYKILKKYSDLADS